MVIKCTLPIWLSTIYYITQTYNEVLINDTELKTMSEFSEAPKVLDESILLCINTIKRSQKVIPYFSLYCLF